MFSNNIYSQDPHDGSNIVLTFYINDSKISIFFLLSFINLVVNLIDNSEYLNSLFLIIIFNNHFFYYLTMLSICSVSYYLM